jgi:transposase
MLATGEFLMLKDLYNQGLSIIEIARRTGYNRRTVSKYAKATAPPAAKKRPAKHSKLDSYKDYVIQRLNSVPLLTASRIYHEIKGMGFTGKYKIVKDFVKKVRPPAEFKQCIALRPNLEDSLRWTGLNAAALRSMEKSGSSTASIWSLDTHE